MFICNGKIDLVSFLIYFFVTGRDSLNAVGSNVKQHLPDIRFVYLYSALQRFISNSSVSVWKYANILTTVLWRLYYLQLKGAIGCCVYMYINTFLFPSNVIKLSAV